VNGLGYDPAAPNPKRVSTISNLGMGAASRPLQERQLASHQARAVPVGSAGELLVQSPSQAAHPTLSAEDTEAGQEDYLVGIVAGEVFFYRPLTATA
jgi:hypothetical protein